MSTLVFLDTETSGLSSTENQILTIGYVVDVDGTIVKERLLKLKHMGGAIDRRALEINGIDLDDHKKNGLHPTDALLELTKDLYEYKDKKIVAHNAAFDKAFVDIHFRKWAVYDEAYIVRSNWMCTMQLANWLFYHGVLKSERRGSNLDNVLRAVGYADRGTDAHGALSDALLTREAYYRMRELSGWGGSA